MEGRCPGDRFRGEMHIFFSWSERLPSELHDPTVRLGLHDLPSVQRVKWSCDVVPWWCFVLVLLCFSVRVSGAVALFPSGTRCGNRIRVHGNDVPIDSDAISASIVPSVQLYQFTSPAPGEGEIIRAGASDQTV